MACLRLLLLTTLVVGCASSGPGSNGTSDPSDGDEPGSTRASRERITAPQVEPPSVPVVPDVVPDAVPDVDVSDPAEVPAPSAGSASTLERPLLTVHVIDEGDIAFDLDAGRFPARAMDPVLHVGELRFVHYVYPSPGVLRFVVADVASLVHGALVYVQYDDDPASRVVVAEALVLP